MSLLDSVGLKRRISAALSVVLFVISGIPGTEAIAQGVQEIAAVFGITGLAHAAKDQTVGRYAVLSAVAVVNVLLGLAPFISQLTPFIPILQKISVVLSSAAIGSKILNK